MAEAVLDTSAVLAFLWSEPGGEIVAELVPRSIISAVNLAEVITKLVDRWVGAEGLEETARLLSGQVEAVSLQTGVAAGLLHAKTRGRGVSLGDRFCLALAQEAGLPVYTADRAWTELGLDLDIRLIR
ncbi:MAG TPA: type II toxin-antitoxin system VapC family toxin [Caulobacteraceae bacterium]|jgi:PIN domain nuclease of toxin-antitoxin system